jgi:hypothetical protein
MCEYLKAENFSLSPFFLKHAHLNQFSLHSQFATLTPLPNATFQTPMPLHIVDVSYIPPRYYLVAMSLPFGLLGSNELGLKKRILSTSAMVIKTYNVQLLKVKIHPNMKNYIHVKIFIL